MDKLGNRENVNVKSGIDVNYAINDLTNRYISVNDVNLAYNSAGNLTLDKDGYSYEYDYENRIVKITKGANDIAEFAYDALGRRIRKTDHVADTNTLYYYNVNWQVLSEYDGVGIHKQSFAYGNYIDEVVHRWAAGPPDQRYYVHDHLYSPVALINGFGSDVERYEYDAYGQPTILDPWFTSERDESNYDNPYYFTGRRADFLDDGNLILQHNRHRYYDYYTGRWLTQDPIGMVPPGSLTNPFRILLQYSSALNLYEYVNSNPINTDDPFGLWKDDVHRDDTSQWAKDKKVCFKDEIGGWCNRPDTDWRRTPVWGAIAATTLIFTGSNPLTISLGVSHLNRVAYWHFPGADVGQPVSAGSSLAQREVSEGIARCNLKIFSEGLHQIQDSYSHQSNGKLPPWLGKVGHSRDRHGWNTEHWNDPVINHPLWTMRFWPGSAKNWALKILRKIRVIISDDADSTTIFASDWIATKSDTKDLLQDFKDNCCKIKEGPHKGKCTHCEYP